MMNKPITWPLYKGIKMPYISVIDGKETLVIPDEYLEYEAKLSKTIKTLSTSIPKRNKNEPVTDKLWEPKK